MVQQGLTRLLYSKDLLQLAMYFFGLRSLHFFSFGERFLSRI